MRHVNEIRFEGSTPWEKAMNEANDYWTKFCDESISKEEKDLAFHNLCLVRYEIESGMYGNNS